MGPLVGATLVVAVPAAAFMEPPTANQGTSRVEVPTPRTGATFTFGVGALNCGSSYVRYRYTAR